MKNRLASIACTAGMLCSPQFTNDTEANMLPKGCVVKKTEEIVKQRKNDLLFTIDDGPSRYILDIAHTLDSLQYEGIFYVVTRGITDDTKKDLIEVIKMGHSVGNHSYDHPNFKKLSFDQAKKQILRSDSLIASVYKEAGVVWDKKYIRYPYGNQPPRYYREEMNTFLDSLGYEKPMFWHMDVDLWDCVGAPKDENIARMKVGDTILLHERSWTVESIKRIVGSIDNPVVQ